MKTSAMALYQPYAVLLRRWLVTFDQQLWLFETLVDIFDRETEEYPRVGFYLVSF